MYPMVTVLAIAHSQIDSLSLSLSLCVPSCGKLELTNTAVEEDDEEELERKGKREEKRKYGVI